MIKAIIIDDEPSAVNVLQMLLHNFCHKDVQVIATSNSPQLGKSMIIDHAPDLVFLDIDMPGMSGIDLVRSFDHPQWKVVFTTAYSDYAVEAFKLSALDYLLKPVEADDIIKVVTKITREQNSNKNAQQHQLTLLRQLLNAQKAETKLAVSMAEKIVFVNISDILYLEAQGAYTSIHFHDGKKLTASKLLGEYESQLTGQNFFRIHHSYMINLQRVKEFQKTDGGYVTMENNKKLEVSNRRRKEFLTAINTG